jgi:hypothetical protein
MLDGVFSEQEKTPDARYGGVAINLTMCIFGLDRWFCEVIGAHSGIFGLDPASLEHLHLSLGLSRWNMANPQTSPAVGMCSISLLFRYRQIQ